MLSGFHTNNAEVDSYSLCISHDSFLEVQAWEVELTSDKPGRQQAPWWAGRQAADHEDQHQAGRFLHHMGQVCLLLGNAHACGDDLYAAYRSLTSS